jgi:rhodanese-related sulfurtransferase
MHGARTGAMDPAVVLAVVLGLVSIWNGAVLSRGWRSVVARDWVSRGATLVDAGTADEFACAHLERAIHLPLEHIVAAAPASPYRTARLPFARTSRVIVYARSPRRSARAATALRGAGCSAVLDLGTMYDW